jgi:hypothetical protein
MNRLLRPDITTVIVDDLIHGKACSIVITFEEVQNGGHNGEGCVAQLVIHRNEGGRCRKGAVLS